MADPFVVDESFKKKISSFKVTELHSLLRNLGASYQANKDQLVKRLIQKYSQIYEQYISGAMSFEEAKAYGDWVNESHVVTSISPISQSSAKVYPYQAPRLSGKPPISFNISSTHPAGATSTNYGMGSNHYTPNVNNNSYSYNNGYNNNNNMYNSSHSNSNSYMPGSTVNQHNHHNQHKQAPHIPPPSTTLKSLSESNYKPPAELIFPKSADPFLEIETTITYSRLKTYSERRPTSFNFQTSETIYNNVRSGAYRVIVRSFEVQNNLTHVSPPHAWPTDCTLSINGTYMNLGIKKQVKPNAPPHPDKPLDISKEIRLGRNTVDITNSSSRTFAVVIDAMRVISVDTLIDVVKRNKTASFESAKKTVSLALSGDDKEIAALHTTVSLQCPLGRTPLVLPAKSLSCRHIQCFDLRNYLMMNQRTPSWKCPVCSTLTNTSNLIIDSYFTELLKHIDSSVHSEVHITPSGDWSTVKPKTPKQEPERSSVASRQAISIIASSPPTVSAQKAKKPIVDVVDLISDDEDEVVPTPSKRIRIEDSPPPSRPMPVITSLASPPPSSSSSSSSTSALTNSGENKTGSPSFRHVPVPTKSSPSLAPRRGSIPNSTTSTQPTLPPLDLNSEIRDPNVGLESEFQPNLQNITSDLDPSAPSTESKKKASILVKLKYPPVTSPPQEPALSSSLSAVSLSSPSPSTFSSPTPSRPPSRILSPPPPSDLSESNGALSSLEVPRLAPEIYPSTGTHPSSFSYMNGYHTHSSPSTYYRKDSDRYSSHSPYNTSPPPPPPLPPATSNYGYGMHNHPLSSRYYPSSPPPPSSSSYYSPPPNNSRPNYSYDLGDYFDDFEPYDYNNNHYHSHYSSHYRHHKPTNNSNYNYNYNYNNNNNKDDDLYDTYNSYYSRSVYPPSLSPSLSSSSSYRDNREQSDYRYNNINHYHPAPVTSSDNFDNNHTTTTTNNDYSNNNNNNDDNHNHDNYYDNHIDNNYNNNNPSHPPLSPQQSFSSLPSKTTQAVIEISDDDGDD